MEINYKDGQTCRQCEAPMVRTVLRFLADLKQNLFATGNSSELIMFASDLISRQNVSCMTLLLRRMNYSLYEDVKNKINFKLWLKFQ